MGYQIKYLGHGKVKISRRIWKPIPKRCVVAGGICLVIAALVMGWQNVHIRNFLLPGDPTVTANALQELVNDLRGGEGLEDSLTAFCIEVLENAQVFQ